MNRACRGSARAFRAADTCPAPTCAAAYRRAGLAPQLCLAHHEEPQTVSVLSVDTWSDGYGGWTWNNWRCVGEIPRFWLSLSTRRLLRLLRTEGCLGLGSVGRVMVDDDGYNLCIQERNGRTLYALAYGERQ